MAFVTQQHCKQVAAESFKASLLHCCPFRNCAFRSRPVAVQRYQRQRRTLPVAQQSPADDITPAWSTDSIGAQLTALTPHSGYHYDGRDGRFFEVQAPSGSRIEGGLVTAQLQCAKDPDLWRGSLRRDGISGSHCQSLARALHGCIPSRTPLGRESSPPSELRRGLLLLSFTDSAKTCPSSSNSASMVGKCKKTL